MKSVGIVLSEVLDKPRHQRDDRPNALSGHEAGYRPRALSDKQRRYPIIGQTVERVREEVKYRKRKYLRRLDTIHLSGSRTHQQTWTAVGSLIEPIMARLDLSTLCLGWMDKDGVFRLNRQRGLAEDSGLTECRVSRTLAALEAARYIRRKFHKLYKNGQWVTRVTIRILPRFFIDLGLGHLLSQARKCKQEARREKMAKTQATQAQEKVVQISDAAIRKESHIKAQARGRIQRSEAERAEMQRMQRLRSEEAFNLRADYPELTDQQIIALVKQKYPIT